MIRRLIMLFVVGAGLFTVPVWGCVHYFMRNYLVLEDGNPLIMPEMSFASEIKCLLKFPPAPPPDPNEKWVSDQDLHGHNERIRKHLLIIDLKDFAEAVQGDPNAQILVDQYTAMRTTMLTWGATFDLAQHEELLNKIPKEFSEYIRGAYAYPLCETDEAISHFDAVLQLLAEQRKYRSTWAAFMLGKICREKYPTQAYKSFEQVRSLAKEGFSDPLNLAGESLAWQARIDGDSARYVDAIHHYAECAQVNVPATTVILSLKWVCNKILSLPTPDPAIVNDPLCREVLTAAIASDQSDKQSKWLAALENATGQGVVAGADRLAWLAYQRGDIQSAEVWLRHCELNSTRAKWVHAKLLLRSGKLNEGVALLQEVVQEAQKVPDWVVKTKEEDDHYLDTIPAPDYAAAETGAVLLGKRDYVGALDSFMHAGFWPDAAYVAERLISVDGKDGLEQYLVTHTEEDPELAVKVERWPEKPVSRLANLRELLARRLAREGEWEKAARYFAKQHTVSFSEEEMDAQEQPASEEEADTQEEADNAQEMDDQVRPSSEFADEALMIAANLKIADDGMQPVLTRAKALFDAAKTLRKDGLELTGTELMPDWVAEGGSFSWNEVSTRLVEEPGVLNRNGGNNELGVSYSESGVVSKVYDYKQRCESWMLRVTDDEVARRILTAAVPYRRFHYRYVAADMMWRCAQMLPNNDPLCAEALYLGGTYLQNRDPLSADKFYKTLVRRNPNLAIAQEANKLKWFPPKFTDEVLYHSPAKSIRKRTMAILGAGGAGLLALVALAVVLAYKRKKAVEPSD